MDLFSSFGIFELLGALLLLVALFFVLKTALWKFFGFEAAVNKEISRRKSSEVRTGKIVEVLAPILEDFPIDVKAPGTSTVFLGQPIDYVHFGADGEVTFIEVKSGNSRLSDFQERIRAAVKAGNVSWAEYRIRGGQ
jgi:predicted Holliday junction resolvase-like endonuclease